jgi:hypothetical protein
MAVNRGLSFWKVAERASGKGWQERTSMAMVMEDLIVNKCASDGTSLQVPDRNAVRQTYHLLN